MIKAYRLVGLLMTEKQKVSATKEKIMDITEELMLLKGYKATTINDICEAAGITKGGFFHYFKDKEQLAHEVLNFFYGKMQEMTSQQPFNQAEDPLERIYGYIDWLVQMSKTPEFQRGCLLGTFAQELSNTHPAIQLQCAGKFTEWAEYISENLKEAIVFHKINKPIDTTSLANYFISVAEGALLLARSKKDGDIVQESFRHYKRYLQTMFTN